MVGPRGQAEGIGGVARDGTDGRVVDCQRVALPETKRLIDAVWTATVVKARGDRYSRRHAGRAVASRRDAVEEHRLLQGLAIMQAHGVVGRVLQAVRRRLGPRVQRARVGPRARVAHRPSVWNHDRSRIGPRLGRRRRAGESWAVFPREPVAPHPDPRQRRHHHGRPDLAPEGWPHPPILSGEWRPGGGSPRGGLHPTFADQGFTAGAVGDSRPSGFRRARRTWTATTRCRRPGPGRPGPKLVRRRHANVAAPTGAAHPRSDAATGGGG